MLIKPHEAVAAPNGSTFDPRRREMRQRFLADHLSANHRKFASIDNLLAAPISPGVTSLKVNNRWFDVEFRDHGHQTTLIYFHAAMAKSQATYPFFGGGMFQDLDVNVLAVSDPAIGGSESLLTGWFGGTKRVQIQRFLIRYLEKFREQSDSQKLMTFGASAGGFAALYYGSQLPGAGIVATNPVTDFSRRRVTLPAYVEKGWPGWNERQVLTRVRHSVIPMIKKSKLSRVAYLQNSQDPVYRDEHLRPLLQANAGDDRIYLKMEHWGKGHVTPPKQVMLGAVDDCRLELIGQDRLRKSGFIQAPGTEDILMP